MEKRRPYDQSALTLREAAESFRLLLRMRIVDVAAVIAWADERILAISDPPLWLLDLALAANESVARVEARLADAKGGGDLHVAAFDAISWFVAMLRDRQLDPMEAARALYIWAEVASISEAEQIKARVPKWISEDVVDGIHVTAKSVVDALEDALARLNAR